MKTVITEESKVHEQWYVDAKKQTLATLPKFLRHLTEDYGHDYGTICHAITAAAIGAAHAVDRTPSGGITGFQGGCIMWAFITNWMSEYKDKPLKLVAYENMLYPQYAHNFEKIITKDTAEYLRREAKKHLADAHDAVHPEVLAHWKKLADGHIPFGYTVKENV